MMKYLTTIALMLLGSCGGSSSSSPPPEQPWLNLDGQWRCVYTHPPDYHSSPIELGGIMEIANGEVISVNGTSVARNELWSFASAPPRWYENEARNGAVHLWYATPDLPHWVKMHHLWTLGVDPRNILIRYLGGHYTETVESVPPSSGYSRKLTVRFEEVK